MYKNFTAKICMPSGCIKKLLRIMKITFFLLFAAMIQVSAAGFAQKVTFTQKDATLKQVFNQINKQTGYNVFWSPKLIKNSQRLDVTFNETPLEDALSICLKGLSLTYSINERTIIIKEKEKYFFDNIINAIDVRGRVVDQKGQPLPGASVKLKGTLIGTVTDTNGQYTISVPNEKAVLVFSFIGFVPQEIPINGRTSLNIVLVEEQRELNEMVVIGYGTQNKMELTGSVGIANMTDLKLAPVSSFSEALAGRVAGLQVSSSDGQPGVGMNIIIRGANSLTQSNTPLYVIDGFPVEDPENAALNPNDIESINILKDASATAIYGARGANGVIVIETKKGEIGKPVISFNSSLGFQKVQKKMEMMSPYEYVKYQYELYPGNATDRYFKNGKTLDSYKDEKGINWQDHLFRRAPMQIHDLSIRGGNAQTKYSISGSIYDQEGVINNSSYKRYQGRMSIDQQLSKKLKAGLIANYSKIGTSGSRIANGTGSTNISTYLLFRAWGFRPVTGTDLNLLEEESDPDIININDIRLNPIITNNNEYTVSATGDMLANAYLSYAITNDLTFKTTGSLNSRQSQYDLFYNSKTVQGSPLNLTNIRGLNGSVNYSFMNVWSNENTLTYKKIINKAHTFTTVGGFSMQGIKTFQNGSASQNIPNEELGIDGLDEGIPYLITSSRSSSKLASFFGRLNYGFKSKYLITATFRGDGSSKLAPGKRWGYFPSAAFAWNMHNEEFLNFPAFISTSKIRTSYGITGNNRVSDFAYLSSLSLPVANSYSFNNGQPEKGVIPNGLGNDELKWESTSQLNIGYDLGLFNNRAELTIDWYRKRTENLLLLADLPVTTGYSRAFKNIGKVQNQGLELSLNTVNFSSKLFNWKSNFNISFNNNKVIELVKGQETMYSIPTFMGSFSNPLYVARVGQPMGMFYGVVFDGVYQFADFENPSPGTYVLKNTITTNGNQRALIQPGDIKYKDLNGDGTINSRDMTVIGRGLPVHTGGLVNNFSYKGFNLNAFLQWSYGNQVYNANRLQMEGNVLYYRDINQFASYVDRWTPENPTNKNFRAGGHGPNSLHSSRVLEDGSYLRLKTISIGYSFPEKSIKKYSLTRLNLNVSAQNLITWTKYSGMDPEVSVRNPVLMPGFDFSAYPQARTITFGLNASF